MCETFRNKFVSLQSIENFLKCRGQRTEEDLHENEETIISVNFKHLTSKKEIHFVKQDRKMAP